MIYSFALKGILE